MLSSYKISVNRKFKILFQEEKLIVDFAEMCRKTVSGTWSYIQIPKDTQRKVEAQYHNFVLCGSEIFGPFSIRKKLFRFWILNLLRNEYKNLDDKSAVSICRVRFKFVLVTMKNLYSARFISVLNIIWRKRLFEEDTNRIHKRSFPNPRLMTFW